MRVKFFKSMPLLTAVVVFSLSLNAFASVVPGPAPAPAPAAAGACEPGCDCQFKETLINKAEALKVREYASTAELNPRPDPSAGLTCLDQAIGVTARQSAIFSDKHDSAVPAANTVVFTPPLAYPNWGADDFFIKDLEAVVLPQLQTHLGNNFGGALSELLGTTVISSSITNLLSSITGPINNIVSLMNGFASDINSILNAINTIRSIAQALNLPLPSPVIIGTVAALEAAQSVADSLMGALQSAMNSAIQPIIGNVMSEIMTPAADMDCDHIAKVWKDDDPADAMVSLQGNGPRMGAPFVSISNFIRGVYPDAGGAFIDAATGIGNHTDILDRALFDVTGGALSAPGAMPSWPVAPAFGNGATTADIISQM